MKNQYLEHVLVMLKQAQLKVEENFCDLTKEQLNWKPNEKTWSIAECLDHLIVTTNLYFGVFEDIKNNRLKQNIWMKLPFWKNFVTNLLLKSVDPETKKKVKTSAPFQPTKSSYSKDIVTDFSTTQAKLITYIHELDGYDHSNIVIPSPLNAMFVYNLSDAFTILWKHQFRHFNQAMRLIQLKDFPQQ